MCWVLIGVAPFLLNDVRRYGTSDPGVGPWEVWIYTLLVFLLVVVLSLAFFWSEVPGVYVRMIFSFSLGFG